MFKTQDHDPQRGSNTPITKMMKSDISLELYYYVAMPLTFLEVFRNLCTTQGMKWVKNMY